jgi:polar amino acid transport system substrate-binding protein
MRHILLALSMAISAQAQAAAYKFCFEPWDPYGVRDDKGQMSGVTIEFYTEAFKKAGHELTFVQVPAERCYDDVKSKRMDGLIFNTCGAQSGTHDLKTQTEYWMVGAIVPESFKGDKFTGIEQFKGKKVGVTKAYQYPESLKGFEGLVKDETTDSMNSLRKLGNGRIDVMFEDPLWTEIKARAENLKFKSLKPLVAADPNCATLSGAHPDLGAKIDAAAQELIKAGLLDKLYKKHTGMALSDFKRKFGIK